MVDLLQLASTKKRKEKLKKKYLFECDCQWCNEDDLSFLGRCPECEGQSSDDDDDDDDNDEVLDWMTDCEGQSSDDENDDDDDDDER